MQQCPSPAAVTTQFVGPLNCQGSSKKNVKKSNTKRKQDYRHLRDWLSHEVVPQGARGASAGSAEEGRSDEHLRQADPVQRASAEMTGGFDV